MNAKTTTSAPRVDVDVQYAVTDAALPGETLLGAWVRAALAGRADDVELTLRIVDRDEMSALNYDYRGKPGPTNVLSFPFEAPPGVELNLLGDIVICAAVVRDEARAQGKPELDHWAHLVVHGVLHLLGYDHIEEDEARVMEALETKILAGLGLPDPYAEREESVTEGIEPI